MRRLIPVVILVALSISAPLAQQARPAARAQTAGPHITTPKEAFGFNLGDDYQLADYKQIEAYWKTLDRESDRMILHDMGKTAEGRTQWMAVVTSPENHRTSRAYRDIAQRLALADGLNDDQARALAKEGKAVVWIDGGLHATETLGAQQLAQMVYEMVSKDDEETRRFLNDCIVLFVHANPDGNDLVADWYMRNANPQQRSLANLPRLYQKYIGTTTTATSSPRRRPRPENINRALYHDWFPQILYNHHQSGPAGRSRGRRRSAIPYNYNLDPLLILGLQALGTHMHQRMADGREARSDDGVGRVVRRLVERRHPQHRQLPQHHRDPDRDDRQPDADAGGVRAAAASSRTAICRIRSSRRSGTSSSRSTTRSRQSRRARLRVAQPREPAVQHLQDGAARDRARQRRLLDAVAVANQRAAVQRWPRCW
jgi:hypothetical protein